MQSSKCQKRYICSIHSFCLISKSQHSFIYLLLAVILEPKDLVDSETDKVKDLIRQFKQVSFIFDLYLLFVATFSEQYPLTNPTKDIIHKKKFICCFQKPAIPALIDGPPLPSMSRSCSDDGCSLRTRVKDLEDQVSRAFTLIKSLQETGFAPSQKLSRNSPSTSVNNVSIKQL